MQSLYYFAVKISAGDAGVPKLGAESVVTGILNTVYIAAGIAAVIVIIISGIFYVISQGDASKVKRAKDGILYSVVGLAVVMLAFVLTNYVVGRIGG
jgi:uncharacterized protein (UPF0212 family)